MRDLIDRQAVLALPKDIVRNMNGDIVEEYINVDDIKTLSSAQQIIRCQDCIYGKGKEHNVRCTRFYGMGGYDEFCSMAEKSDV